MAEQKKFQPTVYAAARFSNPNGETNQSRLGVSYWNNLMGIAIDNKKEGEDETSYSYENGLKVYLTPTKALMLKEAIDRVLSGLVKSSGVPTGSGYVGISKSDMGQYLLTIVKFDESNEISDYIVYEFKGHFLVNDFEMSGNSFTNTKETLADIEVKLFTIHLEEFVKAISYATAYSQAVSSQSDARLNTLFGISSKLGVSNYAGGGSGYSKTSATNIFAGAEDKPVQRGSIDDIM